MANRAFYHSLSVFNLLTKYFETRGKLKVALMTFEVSETKPQNFSKIIKISQSTSYISYLFANTTFKLGPICSLFMINNSLNHELFV
jgi:hypothetical protein